MDPGPANSNLSKDLVVVNLPWYEKLLNHSEDKFFAKLAADNNFSYQKAGPIDGLSPLVANLKGTIEVGNIVDGLYHHRPFRLFTLSLTLKNVRGGWEDTVIEVNMPHSFPPILITHINENIKESVSTSNGIDLTGSLDHFSKVPTESPEFNKIFVAHVEPGNEVEGLQILPPDIIEILTNNASSFRDLELASNKFYTYLDGSVTSADKLIPALDFITQITPKFELLSADFDKS